MNQALFNFSRIPRICIPVLAVCLAMFTYFTADAQLIITAQSVAANAGDTGGGLDITLTNLGPTDASIAGFAFEVTAASSDITFTGVNTSTAPATYIFAGNSLFGPNIGLPVTNQDWMASDVSANGSATTIGAGATLGLGHLVFDVSASASGVYPITIVPFPATSLSDAAGANVDIATLNNGSITVTANDAVPEPGSLALLGGLLVPGAAFLIRRRK